MRAWKCQKNKTNFFCARTGCRLIGWMLKKNYRARYKNWWFNVRGSAMCCSAVQCSCNIDNHDSLVSKTVYQAQHTHWQHANKLNSKSASEVHWQIHSTTYYRRQVENKNLTPFSSGLGKDTVRNSGSGSFWEITGVKGSWPKRLKASLTHIAPTPCIAEGELREKRSKMRTEQNFHPLRERARKVYSDMEGRVDED